MEEIYDGAFYKKLFGKGGLLFCFDNVLFFMNIDGVFVFKFFKVFIWLLYFVINEFNYSKRMVYENMIFVGFWFGEKKLVMWIFFKLYSYFFVVFEKGVYVNLSERGNFFYKGILFVCICDFLVRCLLCNGM